VAEPTPQPTPSQHPTADAPRETAVQTDPTADRQATEQYGTQQFGTQQFGAPPMTGPATEPGTRRSPDLVALVAGVVFCLVAVLGLVGTSLPGWVFGGGLVAVVLVVVGVGVLAAELRRTR